MRTHNARQPAARTRAALLGTACLAVAMIAGPASLAQPPAKAPAGLVDPNEVKTPGLEAGEKAPALTLPGADGSTVDLATLYKQGPVVVTFYRGGWCPFCQRAMAQWNSKVDDLVAAGGTFVAISPETAEHALKSQEKWGGESVVALVDKEGAAMRAFRVGFALDANTQSLYKRYGHDLAKDNASGRWELPAPATFVVDRQGVIRWVFADWNYRKRANPDDVIAQVRALTGGAGASGE